MRPLIIQVPRESGATVTEIAESTGGKNVFLLEGSDKEEKISIVILSIPNRKIEQLLDRVNSIDNVKITLLPQGVITLYPPADKAPEQVTDVQPRSPIEIFLSGLQSIGSWKGLTGYATIAGFIVWIGFFTNTVYLLVAAMLIAPFAGPAMNTAIATARGDPKLMKQSLIRYFVSIFLTISGTLLLSIIMGLEIATPLMEDQSQISSIAILLPLSAGIAGGLNLIQSERDSLVSGAAVGMLVAASLAPPAGVVGMAIAIEEWEMVCRGLFLLFLQLIGINLTGSLIFRLFGLKSQGVRYMRGKNSFFIISLLVTAILAGSLLYLQLRQSPELERSSKAQRAAVDIQEVVDSLDDVQLIETNVRFTGVSIEEQPSLLCIIYVRINTKETERIKTELRKNILKQLSSYNLIPLVDITILE